VASLAPARAAALELFSERRRRDARARDLLRTSPRMAALDERDRALATRLVMGSVAAEGELDRVIDAHLRRGGRLEPRVRDALRIAAFETLYLSTPTYVSTSQGVELVRSVAPRVAGLANAVLHRVVDEDLPVLLAARERVESGDYAEDDLARVGALPAWLMSRVGASCGRDVARRVALSALDAAPLYVGVNRARRSVDEAFSLLADAGCEPAACEVEGAFELGRPSGLAASGLVEAVDVLPADLAAQYVARAVAPRSGETVLEVGQGRGTKTVLMESAALATGGPATIVAVDVDEAKACVSRHRMKQAGIAARTSTVVLDATLLGGPDIPPALDRGFGVVLVDAPCSGTGTMRRHPEIAWSLMPEVVDPARDDSLPALQLRILRAAASRVRVGGTLAYATCSLLAEEDERVVEGFLASAEGAAFTLAGEPGRVCLDDGRSDTHFLARLTRLG
jgi:16S rRNA (cytosine967-C5)-methyltransferase